METFVKRYINSVTISYNTGHLNVPYHWAMGTKFTLIRIATTDTILYRFSSLIFTILNFTGNSIHPNHTSEQSTNSNAPTFVPKVLLPVLRRASIACVHNVKRSPRKLHWFLGFPIQMLTWRKPMGLRVCMRPSLWELCSFLNFDLVH